MHQAECERAQAAHTWPRNRERKRGAPDELLAHNLNLDREEYENTRKLFLLVYGENESKKKRDLIFRINQS